MCVAQQAHAVKTRKRAIDVVQRDESGGPEFTGSVEATNDLNCPQSRLEQGDIVGCRAAAKRANQGRALEASRITPPGLSIERLVLLGDDPPNPGIGTVAQHPDRGRDGFRVLGSAQ
jgi:hypothetical protein